MSTIRSLCFTSECKNACKCKCKTRNTVQRIIESTTSDFYLAPSRCVGPLVVTLYTYHSHALICVLYGIYTLGSYHNIGARDKCVMNQ